ADKAERSHVEPLAIGRRHAMAQPALVAEAGDETACPPIDVVCPRLVIPASSLVIPANAGIHPAAGWIPAFARMTGEALRPCLDLTRQRAMPLLEEGPGEEAAVAHSIALEPRLLLRDEGA